MVVKFIRNFIVLLLSCATPKAAEPIATIEAPAAQTSDAELEQAWAPTPTESDAPRVITVTDTAAPADHRGAFRGLLATAQAALSSKQFEQARTAARDALTEGESLPTDEREQAWALLFKVEHAASPEPARAKSVALEWRSACLSTACRTRALNGLARVSGLAPLAKKLFEFEACVAQGERARQPVPCLAKVQDPTRDEVSSARVALVHALGEKAPRAHLERVEASCKRATGCLAVRRVALTRLAALAVEGDDLEGAVKYLLREGQLLGSQVAPELRTWARSSELDAACARLDAKAGAGTCRKLEKQVTGGLTFRDFSSGSAGQGLRPELVKQVNEHYAPLLQECLTEQAKRMTVPDAQRFEVRWTVHNDGRVRDAHLRRDLDQLPLAQCLRTQFSTWRYPRFDGEFMNVEQSFTVTATTRR